ncbi:MAG: hypothetical protein IPP94_05640 [Ignavibacteria bacterium]|nr:hypothetical protein [Ignavibacteria bacterium]
MNNHTLQFWLLLLALLGPSAAAQFGGTISIDDRTTATVTAITDTNGVSWSQYIEVAQFSPAVSLRLVAGEIRIANPAGHTAGIGWDHPLTHTWKSEFVPVYQYNSAAFANPAVTEAFTLHAGDTLALFRDFGFRFPVSNEDGTERTLEEDTAGFVLPDSIIFSMDLIDAQSGALVRTVDRFVMPPCNGWSAFLSVLAASVHPRMMQNDRHPFLLALVADQALDGARVRLRINPQYLSRIPGTYTERAMYMRFAINPRLSAMVAETWDHDMAAAREEFEDVVEQLGLPKQGNDNAPKNADLLIYPSLVYRSAPVLRVWHAHPNAGDAVVFQALDITGRVLFQEERRSQGEKDMLFRLPERATQSALALVVVRVNTKTTHNLIRFF